LNWTDLVVEALGETVYVDLNKLCRLQQDWDIVFDEGAIYLKANDINMDRKWLRACNRISLRRPNSRVVSKVLGSTDRKVRRYVEGESRVGYWINARNWPSHRESASGRRLQRNVEWFRRW